MGEVRKEAPHEAIRWLTWHHKSQKSLELNKTNKNNKAEPHRHYKFISASSASFFAAILADNHVRRC